MPALGELSRVWIAFWQGLAARPVARLLSANGDPLVLTTGFQYIDNAFVLLDRQGLWLITGIFDFLALDGCGVCQGQLEFNGVEFNGLMPPAIDDYAVLSPAVGVSLQATIAMGWAVPNVGRSYAKLLARKTAAGGGGSAINKNTKLFAQFIG